MSGRPTDEQLRAAARRAYGTGCSQSHCKARGDDRAVNLPIDLQPERDDQFGGTWIAAYIWISDEDVER